MRNYLSFFSALLFVGNKVLQSVGYRKMCNKYSVTPDKTLSVTYIAFTRVLRKQGRRSSFSVITS